MDRVNPDRSVRLNLGETEVLVDRVYDHVHIFSWLGHGILKIITEKGLMQAHVSEADARRVAEEAGIKPLERDEISAKEYEKYLETQESRLDDSWLTDGNDV